MLTEVQLMVATLVEKAVEVLDQSVVVFLRIYRIRDEEQIHSLASLALLCLDVKERRRLPTRTR